MPKADSAEEPNAVLARLPPGRHGLPREFVARNQSGRVTAGLIAVAVESGFHETTVTRVVAAAGLSRRTFYGIYANRDDAFLGVFGEVTGFLLGAMDEAREEERRGWPARVRAQLGALIACFEANPDLGYFCLEVPRSAGGEIAAAYRDFLPSLVGRLVEGRPQRTRRPPEITEYFLAGGLAALVVGALGKESGGALRALVPELTQLVLAPYLGLEAAAATA